MAHFAKLSDGVVTDIVVINNSELMVNGVESEAKGVEFLTSIFGADTTWVQTSYNGSFRKNYASIGFTYDSTRDAFIAQKPFPSWSLNETTCKWEAPVPCPTDGNGYFWEEEIQSWLTIEQIIAEATVHSNV